MLKFMKIAPAALVLVLIFISASFAQQTATTPAAKSDDDFVTEKGFKSKVFEVKYRDAGSLAKVLGQLGSGFKGASVSSNSEFKTITVRDFPENLATIEEAIKRLDTPAAPRPNIELHIHVLVASNTSGAGDTTAQIPAELKDVLTQLRGTFNYRNYELAATVVQRLTETQRGLQGLGAGEISGGNPAVIPNMVMPYQYIINSVSLVQNPSGAPTVQINEFMFVATTDKDRAQVQTALNLRDGEKVVVGTATIRNRALIIVLTAKLVN
jgi:type II secretory pathway component GspD/PulD (secretin)